MSIGLDWKAKSPGKSEVGKLDYSVFINKKVLWFQVSMHNSMGMAISSSLKNLVSEAFNFLRRKWPTDMSHVFLQIIIAIFENQVEFIFRIYHLFQSILFTIIQVLTLRY